MGAADYAECFKQWWPMDLDMPSAAANDFSSASMLVPVRMWTDAYTGTEMSVPFGFRIDCPNAKEPEK